MTEMHQLSLPMGPDQTAIDTIVSIARDAVDLNRRPGYAAFTSGNVTIEQVNGERIVLETDSPWAASAIRRKLLDAGCAVEGDPAHEATTVTAWATAKSDDTKLPEVTQTQVRDKHGRAIVLFDGPHGMVEQQVGSGGHNDLIVHAQHPFPGAVRTTLCARHGDCWMRSQWTLAAEPRRHIRTVLTDTGYAWDITPAAGQAMRALYLEHIHQTRPGDAPVAFRVALPSQLVAEAASPQPIEAIRDISDYEPTA